MLKRKKINTLNNFSLGLITKIRELNGMDVRGTPDCMDVYADLDGSLHKRLGRTKLNVVQTGAGTKNCHGLFDFEGTAVSSFGTTYYKMDELDGTWDSLQTGMKDEPIECEDYDGNLVICNWGWDFAKTMQVGDTSMSSLNTSNIAGRGKHPKVYKDHLLMSGVLGYDYTMYYSEVDDFDDFANGGTWPIVTHDGDVLTAHGELQGRLYEFKRWSIHQMTYRGGSPYWVRRHITSGVGTRSSLSVKNVTLKSGEEVLMFLGSDRKLYQFNGYDANPVSANFEENNGICPISMETLNQGSLDYCHAVVDPVRHWYILFVGNGGTSTMTHGIVFNYFTGACWPFSNQTLKASASMVDANRRRWIIAGDYDGFSYYWNYGNIDEVGFTNAETGADGSLDDAVDEYLRSAGAFLTGKIHDAGDGRAYAQDASENFTTLGVLVGDMAMNKTDKCYAEISAIGNGAGTNDKLTLATLAGGTDNDFDDDDEFEIYKGLFIADNDSIYIASPVKFNTVVVDLIQVGSATITPTISYSSDAIGGYTALTVTDGTIGFSKSGVITYTTPSWTKTNVDDGANAFTDTATYYYLKIQRTANALTTKPKVSKISIGNAIAAYHTTPRLLISKDKLVEVNHLVLSLRSVSDDNISFQSRADYNITWNTAETWKLGSDSGEYYLGVDLKLGTATLGPNQQVVEKTQSLDLQGEYVQFKISDSLTTGPWTLYSYSFPSDVIGITKQET